MFLLGDTFVKSRTPSYLFQNRFGTFYFQYRTPSIFVKSNTDVKVLIRKSLITKKKSLALSRARLWRVKIDELKFRFLDTPEKYGEALSAQR